MSYSVADAVRTFLMGEEYQPPALLLGDLTPDQAMAVPDGAPYCIAEVLAHTVYWQEVWLARIEKTDTPPADEGANADWPQVNAEDWSMLRDRFINGAECAWKFAEDTARLPERLEDGKTIGQMLLHLVQHNNYHFGQIALLRQLVGLWPPTGSDDVWEKPLHA